jgi:uncharacterized membrane protein
VWTGTTMKDLGRLDEHVSDGWDINDSGQVVGDADLDKDLDADRVFMWNGSTRKTLGRGTGAGINASGQVTGSKVFSGNVNPHPFLGTAARCGISVRWAVLRASRAPSTSQDR